MRKPTSEEIATRVIEERKADQLRRYGFTPIDDLENEIDHILTEQDIKSGAHPIDELRNFAKRTSSGR